MNVADHVRCYIGKVVDRQSVEFVWGIGIYDVENSSSEISDDDCTWSRAVSYGTTDVGKIVKRRGTVSWIQQLRADQIGDVEIH